MKGNLKEAVDRINLVTEEAVSKFGSLTAEQLNWKPGPGKWSIAQCLDHLMVSNNTYYQQLNEVIAGSHRNSLYQSIRPLSNFFGNWLIKETGPVVGKPMKNPAPFAPSQSDLPATIVSDFAEHQKGLTAILLRLDSCDLDNTIISSPALGIITYNLNSLLSILAGHEQRHLNQAKNVLTLLAKG